MILNSHSALPRILILATISLLAGTAPQPLAQGQAQAAGQAASQAANQTAVRTGIRALVDAVYNGEKPSEIEKKGQELLASIGGSNQPAGAPVSSGAGTGAASGAATGAEPATDPDILRSEIEYLVARSWNEAGEKKKAITLFDSAIAHAEASLARSETARGLLALTRATAEVCLLKDMIYLMNNGPKISRYAKRILELDPGNPGASLILASSKAYPPAIFGGNPREAIESVGALLASGADRFEKDQKFDAMTCLGTACDKLGRKDEAKLWFGRALELYPGNNYARTMLVQVSK